MLKVVPTLLVLIIFGMIKANFLSGLTRLLGEIFICHQFWPTNCVFPFGGQFLLYRHFSILWGQVSDPYQ